jgi:hypothetical protein
MVKAQSSIHKSIPKSCNHIFTLNETFSIKMLNIEFIICCIQNFKNFNVLKVVQKYF